MLEKNSKFPRFFILMLIPLALIMLVGMFFGVKIVSSTYFIALLIAIVFLMLDKHHGENLANYKLSFFLFDVINLIAVVSIMYYEYGSHSMLLNIFLTVLCAVLIFLIVFDCVILRNKDITKRQSVYVSLVKMGSMISLLTYFYNVSILFFAIDALIFELANVVLKMIIGEVKIKRKDDKNGEFDLVSVIRAEEDEGDLD